MIRGRVFIVFKMYSLVLIISYFNKIEHNFGFYIESNFGFYIESNFFYVIVIGRNQKGDLMLKNIITVSMLSFLLLFSACGGDNEAEDALVLQEKLDNGDFDGVIASVEPRASSSADYVTLASAYMGRAGFSFSSLIGIVVSSAESGGDSTFEDFIQSIAKSSNTGSLQDLASAIKNYEKIVDRCATPNVSLSGSESDICLYIGLSEVSRTAVAMGYIADDVSAIGDDTKDDDKLTASTCAMQYAFDGNRTQTDCTISSEQNLTFVQSTKTYGDINVTVNGKKFEYLITGTVPNPRSTILTSGYCTVNNFATRVESKTNATYHVCPINESSGDDITTDEVLVNSLNNGVDSIGAATSDDVSSDMDQFRNEILAANNRENDSNKTVTTEDMIKYLSK